MGRRAPWSIVLAVTCAAAACSADAAAPTAEVVDSAGVRILSYDLMDVPVPTYRTVAPHDLEIGALDGAPEYTFSIIADLTRTEDSEIVVSDGVAGGLRVYDAGGTYVRSIGRLGEGPGEFSGTPLIAGISGDTVFAFDTRQIRLMPERSRTRRVRSPSPGIVAVQQADVPYSPRAFVRSDGLGAVSAFSDAFEVEWQGPTETSGRSCESSACSILPQPTTSGPWRKRSYARTSATARYPPRSAPLHRLPAGPTARLRVCPHQRQGGICVARMEFDGSGGYDWLVFTPTGELRGLVHTPPDLQLFAIRDVRRRSGPRRARRRTAIDGSLGRPNELGRLVSRCRDPLL